MFVHFRHIKNIFSAHGKKLANKFEDHATYRKLPLLKEAKQLDIEKNEFWYRDTSQTRESHFRPWGNINLLT